jgi:hypothetical protein
MTTRAWFALCAAIAGACASNSPATDALRDLPPILDDRPRPPLDLARERRGDAADAARPNIIFVLTDDQRADSAVCMGKLAQLVGKQGITFTRNYASTPLCCPGRSSVLTGKYAHNHGVRTNGDVEEGDTASTPGAIDFRKGGNEALVFAKWLQGAGYRTGFFGKYLNGYDKLMARDANGDGKPDLDKHVPPHWDDWFAFPHAEYFDFQLIERPRGAGTAKRVCYLSSLVGEPGSPASCKQGADQVVGGQEHYSTDVLKDKALAFVAGALAEGKPFFLYFAPKAPHAPFLSPTRYQPDPKLAQFSAAALARVGSCPLFEWAARPASFLEADVSDKPEWVAKLVASTTTAAEDKTRKLQLVSCSRSRTRSRSCSARSTPPPARARSSSTPPTTATPGASTGGRARTARTRPARGCRSTRSTRATRRAGAR